jgi:hypothetical protein
MNITSNGMAASACFVLVWNMSLDSYNIFIELVFMSHELRFMKKVYRIRFYEFSLNMSRLMKNHS